MSVRKIFLFLILSGALYTTLKAQTTSESWHIRDGYLSKKNLDVLMFSNQYPVGFQGGIEIIQHENRVATNGNVVFEEQISNPTGSGNVVSEPIPKIKIPDKTVDARRKALSVAYRYDKHHLGYDIRLIPDGDGFKVDISFDEKLDVQMFSALYFKMDFYPGLFKGKSFICDGQYGMIPWDYTNEVYYQGDNLKSKPLATGHKLILAPEDPMIKMTIECEGNRIKLFDQRYQSNHQWFSIQVDLLDAVKQGLTISFKPNVEQNWERQPVINYSQAGYHPNQEKVALIELPDHAKPDGKMFQLYKLNGDKHAETVLQEEPVHWGLYMRYNYFSIDFSSVTEPGLYQISYDGVTTTPFRISADIYKSGMWQPVMETFLPVQMCHMKVKDVNKLWHGLCHMDDGLQIPPSTPFFDGFAQSEKLDSRYKPNTTIPGMNTGGWHDAGDDDVNTGSSGKTTYHLALMAEEFGLETDQTTVNVETNEVLLHRPDGRPDVIQQLEHGLNWLLAQYRVSDHSFVGVISHDWETYIQNGDWGHMTDNLFYNPTFAPDSSDGRNSGIADDRYVFTNKDTRREYLVAAIFAASSRVMKTYDTTKANEALKNAVRIWECEQNHEPVIYGSVGTPSNLIAEKTNAAVELYLTTGQFKYLDAIVKDTENVLANIESTGWTLARVMDDFQDDAFRDQCKKALQEYQQSLNKKLSANPFGVDIKPQVWGYNWEILWFTWKHYYLIKNHPEIFSEKVLLDAINYTLGCHPASNISHVSGVGAHKPIPAFGINRDDFAYIPGGVMSGVGLVKPDFFELKDDHPFIWQQSEYIVFGGTPFIFCVLAADKLLEE